MKKIVAFLIVSILIFSSCVQQEFDKIITLKVDTNGLENIESIGIRGSFLPNQWRETVPLTDDNNDGIYEITFNEKTAIYSIDFKFIKNGTEYELKGIDNREIVFEYKPETIIYKAKLNVEKPIQIIRK